MENLAKWAAATFGAVVSFFAGMPPLIWVLLGVMSLDYATGILCGCMGVSPKTEGGGLSSRAAFTGLLRKMVILIVVALAALIDCAVAVGAGVQFSATTGAVCLWFIASEGISILENAVEAAGVNAPPVLRRALEVLKGKGEDEERDE